MMTTLMNCDDVFDVLTRRPFPSGDTSDAEVELHLCACHECRSLAEALRPAVGLIHESLHEPDETLPAYRGRIEVALPVQPVMLRQTDEGVASPQRSPWRFFMFGGLAGVAAALVLWLATSQVEGESSRFGSVAETQARGIRISKFGVPDQSGRELLASLGIMPACLREKREAGLQILDRGPFERPPAVSTEMQDFVCCTLCHSARVSIAPERTIRKVTLACAACHKSSATESHATKLPAVDSLVMAWLRKLPAC